MVTFAHRDLRIVEPGFGTNLNETILELDHLRTRRLGGTVPQHFFFQLKSVMHQLESWASARIEGNKTTLAELVEKKIEGFDPTDEKTREITNIDAAMEFVEQNVKPGTDITRSLISEIHKITVHELKREGSISPGAYRDREVEVKDSKTGLVRFVPPLVTQVPHYMDELHAFINEPRRRQFDLLTTALSHHRFVWAHPFDNGNGRTVRLLTYAMLIRQGFNVVQGRILNPTAVFCEDRDKYYAMLHAADSGTDEGLLQWCTYVLEGLLREIKKIDQLADKKFVTNKILKPAIHDALANKYVTEQESKVLLASLDAKDMVMQAKDIESVVPGNTNTAVMQRTRLINKLKEKKMLASHEEGGRKYYLSFVESYLLRGVIRALEDNNMVVIES